MTINKNLYFDIVDRDTNGAAGAALINDNKRAVNEVVDYVNTFDNERGTAAKANIATNTQALAGTAGVLPDAEGVHAAFQQSGWWRGVELSAIFSGDVTTVDKTTLRRVSATAIGLPIVSFGYLVSIYRTSQFRTIIFYADNGRTFQRAFTNTGDSGWLENHHTGNMQPDLANGLNSPRLMRNVSGATVNNEADAAGSGLRFCDFSTTGVLTASATAGTGTWKNISGTALAANEYGFFVRIA